MRIAAAGVCCSPCRGGKSLSNRTTNRNIKSQASFPGDRTLSRGYFGFAGGRQSPVMVLSVAARDRLDAFSENPNGWRTTRLLESVFPVETVSDTLLCSRVGCVCNTSEEEE